MTMMTATMTTTAMTTTMMAMMTTTERRIRMTVQNRLTITVAILSVLALTVVGLVLYTVEANNLEGRNSASMTQEIAEMRSFAQNGVDPETGERFTSVDQILTQFLAQNRPDEDETLFAFLSDGRVLYQGDPNSAVNSSQEFEEAVAGVSADGGEIKLTIDGDEYEGYVLPITSGPGGDATGGNASGGDTASGSPTGADNGPGSFVVVHNVTASHTDLTHVMQIYIVVALAAALLISGISSVLARKLLAPVTELRQTAQSISGGDLSSRITTRGHDDIAELGRTFNDMLDRLEASFETQRRFLDDVGHELRTPLTILSGHLETMDSSDVDDVDETRTMLLDETDRMARLVEELLILARSRRPDFVRPEQVDVPSLLNESLAKAKGLGQRDWRLETPPAIVITADRQRLTQALLQLASNAVEHTEEDQPITFGARIVDDKVHIWVRDEGHGVPDEIAADIFERFSRGSTEGHGFGLGLSIIKAIAEAHGGTVVLDHVSRGAQFRMILPKGPL
ncbi:sensor histidine kinase [Brevibacterium zhoupengii]|uniref:sensor histidine kinase n=1 Tax=Brevibacterium zhoupengii TaxID=2898795 RepID=UPI001E3970D2|nr:HAMP domain-containing sensor histidine kinase [Brevibacterium zhoupengii]